MQANRQSSGNRPGVTRRGFLRASAATTGMAAASHGLTILAAESKGINDRPGVGFVGTGGRCQAHIDIVNKLQQAGRVEPVAVCDVYGPRVRAAAKKTGGTKIYRQVEELLDDPNVDIVCIATPDRHHAPQAIRAVRAGKDVYVEKPLTHWKQFPLALQLVEEAAKHKRVVTVGTQYMADDAYAKAHDLLKEGVIGKIVHCQAGYFRRGDWGERMAIPDPNAQPGPDLDWQQFLGDAPQVPFSVSRFFQWRLYLDYAGGPATDLLVHTYTPIFRMLDVTYPERVVAGGGVFQYDREVPDTFNMTIDYPDGPSVVLMNTLSNFTPCETIMRGTHGALTFKKGGMEITPYDAKRPAHILRWKGQGSTEALWSNFVDCVHSREVPLSPVDIGAQVQAPLNMALLAYLQNKVARFDRDQARIVL
jgi:predicted dehydrogenase